MRHVLRSTAVMLAALLGAASMAFAPATAAPSAATCRGPQYPTGVCKVYFNKGQYHRGDKAKFYSDRAFKPGETVTGKLVCQKKFTLKPGPWKAGDQGRVRGHFTIADKTPYGTCKFTLRGKTTGATAVGTFKVVKG
jgi:hypothetical protein